MINVEILEHSIAEDTLAEAFTFRITLPRIVLAELNTHRIFAKNTSSSRAIPIKKMLKHVRNNMFEPVHWGANQAGMQAHKELTGLKKLVARHLWKLFGYGATICASMLNSVGVHKQITNRLIENFSYVTMIVTTVDIDNFLALRNHPDAQPEIRAVASAMLNAVLDPNKKPAKRLKFGEWHLPLIHAYEWGVHSLEDLKKVSAARCASTSYRTVDGKDMTIERALKIYDKLASSQPIHASPFEHQLTPDRRIKIDYRITNHNKKYRGVEVWERPDLHGCTPGFKQYRKMIPGESSYSGYNSYFLP